MEKYKIKIKTRLQYIKGCDELILVDHLNTIKSAIDEYNRLYTMREEVAVCADEERFKLVTAMSG